MKTLTTLLAIIAGLALQTTAAFAVVFSTNLTINVGNSTYDGQDIVVSYCTLTVNAPQMFFRVRVDN